MKKTKNTNKGSGFQPRRTGTQTASSRTSSVDVSAAKNAKFAKAEGRELSCVKRSTTSSRGGAEARRLNVVSLFSGAGGLDVGLAAAGFDLLFENDINSYCCKTLEAAGKILPQMKDAEIVCGDIKNISGPRILQHVRALGKEVDLLAGGPPCQAFSVFGNRKGREDARGQMVDEYFRILGEIAPPAFVFENVFGLLTVQNGEVFKLVKEKLAHPTDALEYDIRVFRLNAVDYGVPQFRDRIIIIGSRLGTNVTDIPKVAFENPKDGQLRYRTVRDGLRNLPPPNEKSPSIHTGRVHGDAVIRRYDVMEPGARDVHTRINRLDLDRPSFTIICGSEHSGGKGHVHPTEPREVTPRESARMQTFPDWWPFYGVGRHAIRQVGNAVPALLAFAIGNEIRSQIFGMKKISFKRGVRFLGQEHLFQ